VTVRAWAALSTVILATLLAITACSDSGDRAGLSSAGPLERLVVLAGSEAKDLEAPLRDAARRAGVELELRYAGTLDIVDRVNGGEAVDAVLPSNGAYPSLALAKPPIARERLFYSRVALGVKAAKLTELGWDRKTPTWADIAAAASAGRFGYAMTNPTTSNTGMSALFAVASAGARKTEDLQVADVDEALLRDFLAGQRIVAGSSGWLAEVYQREPGSVDGMVNYEAVILRLNDRLAASDRLTLVFPVDGVITADYPLLLLNEDRRGAFGRLVESIRGHAFQTETLQAAYLRPSVAGTALAKALPTAAVAELAFPNRLEVIDTILASHGAQWRRPATSIFVLDVSGSMKGQRIVDMRMALTALAGAGTLDKQARLARFQIRERVVMLVFSSRVGTPIVIDFGQGDADAARQRIVREANALEVGGGTAIYSALRVAQTYAFGEIRRDPGRYVSIVLLTDGENNEGITFQRFQSDYRPEPRVRVFPILFGEGNLKEMERLAELTGGRTFDGRTVALTQVFKEIRGYQ
jgi:Ca-activated chloride channel family protein